MPLSGLQTLRVPTTAVGADSGIDQHIYTILASTHGTSELGLLTSDKSSSDDIVFGPTFSGLLNVCESYGDTSINQVPQVIPAASAPSIPPGLKQRFHPFGSKTPTLTYVAENETDGAAFGPSSTTLRPLVVKRFTEDAHLEVDEHEMRKTKKKKKEKRIKTEREVEMAVEAPIVKLEPLDIPEEVMMEPSLQQEIVSEEKRKKKKKKKEREEVEEGLEPTVRVKTEYVPVKCEPVDTSYGDGVECLGKKKKKKKSKTEND